MTPEQKIFLEKIEALKGPLFSLLLAYEDLNESQNSDTSKFYPFGSSYDEWLHEYYNWANQLSRSWSGKVFDHNPTLTVGELKTIIADLEDSIQVVVEDRKKAWWLNINETQKPDMDGMFTLTFSTIDTFDTRQL